MNPAKPSTARRCLLLVAVASLAAAAACHDDVPYTRPRPSDAGEDVARLPDSSQQEDGVGDDDVDVNLADQAADVPEVCQAVDAVSVLDFGTVPFGESLSLDTGIRVLCSDAPAASSPFSVTVEGDRYAITFRPVAEARYTDTVSFDTVLGVRDVELSGVGYDPGLCPVARITPEDGAPGPSGCLELQTGVGHGVVLSAAESEAFGIASIAEYDWVARSDTGPEHRGDEEIVGMVLGPGTHQIDLDVVDSLGRRSCEPDSICVRVTTEADLMVQLTWVANPAREPSASSRVDLDLHLLHPDGWWGDLPWDCGSSNSSPRWGEPGTGIGNPELFDSGSSAQPEQLEMLVAEPLVYKLGVFSYSLSEDASPTAATVRVWIRGEQVLELQHEFATNNVFWEVGEVSMVEDTVNVVDIAHEGMP